MLDVKTATPREIADAVKATQSLNEQLIEVRNVLHNLRNKDSQLILKLSAASLVALAPVSPKNPADPLLEKMFRPYLIAKFEEHETYIREKIAKTLGGTPE